MSKISVEINELPHGHGASFKKGLSDGIFDKKEFINDIPTGHEKSYQKGISIGNALCKEIAKQVKD